MEVGVEVFDTIMRYVQIAGWSDYIDIILMAFIIYRLMILLRDTSAERLVKGIFVYFFMLQLAATFQLNTIHILLESALSFGTTALLIVFQPELRRALEQMGKGHFRRLIGGDYVENDMELAINQTVTACESMSWSRTGVLMAFERSDKLSEIAKTGTRIDAEPSAELLKNVFYPKSPLHDGALIMREGRMLAAGCVLPLSNSQGLSRDLGTRHRAAVGMSEASDAVLVVVSEETGAISVAIGGMLKRHLTAETLRRILKVELMPEEEDNNKKNGMFGRVKTASATVLGTGAKNASHKHAPSKTERKVGKK